VAGIRSLLSVLALSSLLLAGPPTLVRAESDPVTAAVPEDPGIAAVVAPLAAELRATFGQVLVQAPQGLAKGHGGQEDLLGFWVTDLMRSLARAYLGRPADLAITNNGGFRKNLAPGPVKVEDLYELMPFENQVVVCEFTGAEVLAILREALAHGGEPFSGAKVTLGGTPEHPRFEAAWEDGRPIDPRATYAVATSDYLLANGAGMATLMAGRKPLLTGVTLRQAMLDDCARLRDAHRDLLPPSGVRYAIPAALEEARRKGGMAW
jgi:2',3'-cyclic-nucleotide 2'-phosphodiesterase (5'-nucleotidase family)